MMRPFWWPGIHIWLRYVEGCAVCPRGTHVPEMPRRAVMSNSYSNCPWMAIRDFYVGLPESRFGAILVVCARSPQVLFCPYAVRPL